MQLHEALERRGLLPAQKQTPDGREQVEVGLDGELAPVGRRQEGALRRVRGQPLAVRIAQGKPAFHTTAK